MPAVRRGAQHLVIRPLGRSVVGWRDKSLSRGAETGMGVPVCRRKGQGCVQEGGPNAAGTPIPHGRISGVQQSNCDFTSTSSCDEWTAGSCYNGIAIGVQPTHDCPE